MYLITESSNAVCPHFNELQFLFKCTSYHVKSESFISILLCQEVVKLLNCICWSKICTSLYSILLSKRLLKATSITKCVLAVTQTNKNVLFSLLPKDLKIKWSSNYWFKSYLKNRNGELLTEKDVVVLISAFLLSGMHPLIIHFRKLLQAITEIKKYLYKIIK